VGGCGWNLASAPATINGNEGRDSLTPAKPAGLMLQGNYGIFIA